MESHEQFPNGIDSGGKSMLILDEMQCHSIAPRETNGMLGWNDIVTPTVNDLNGKGGGCEVLLLIAWNIQGGGQEKHAGCGNFGTGDEGNVTRDICLVANPLVVIERKTVADFLGSITSGRQRFNDELRRARFLDCFTVIIEESLPEVNARRGGMSESALLGTIAAFSRRGIQIIFAGTEGMAAIIAWRLLSQPITEANRLVKDCAKPTKGTEAA